MRQILIIILIYFLAGCGGGGSVTVTTTVQTPIVITGTPSFQIDEESTYSFIPSITTVATGFVIYSIINKPNWASFDTSNGALTGIPDDADIGLHPNMTISATDDIGKSSIGPFSITVKPVNDAPVLSDQSKSGLTLGSAVSFSLTSTDVDSIASSFVYTVISQASNGNVVVINHQNSTFEYQSLSAVGISTDSFTVQLSDGEDLSAIATITLGFNSGATPPSSVVISGTPESSVNEEGAFSFTPTITDVGTGKVIFTIENKPVWASFNTTNGALSGTPDDLDIGMVFNITITATDEVGSSSIGPFSIIVNAVNDAPSIANQTKSSLVFSSNVAFTLSASDLDSASSSYVYSVISPASDGTVVIIDHETSAFEYQPFTVYGISGDSFTVQLSDGVDVSAIVTVTLAFSDATAPSLTLSPSDGASNVAVDTKFIITADDPLDYSSLTYNGSAGACTGSVQISKDSFTNCIGITSAVASNLNRLITITGAADIDNGTAYKFKVTTGVANLLTVNVASNVTNTFTSVSAVSEIVISGTPAASVDEESAYSFTPTVTTAATGTAIYSITNKPTWASFNTSNGALTGTPDDANIGMEFNITITATDDVGTSSVGPFSITVNPVNDAPTLADQTNSSLAFNSNVAFTLSASDVDSATSTYVYSVISQANGGTVVITDHETSAFEYQPSSVSGISGDSFTVQLSDGTDTSATATITLAFSDATAPSLTLSPSDGAENLAVDTTYTITSDDPLDTSTLTYNGSEGACTGSVQISKDSFTNCIGITSAVASNLNRLITITGAANIDNGTAYKFKVSTGVENLFSVNVATDVINTLTSISVAAPIVISGTPASSVDEESAYSFTPTVTTSATGTAVFSIANKPSWASFDTNDGALTGTPDDASIGTDSNITITATDDVGTSDVGPFSITVNAVNDAPVLADQTKSSLAFSSNGCGFGDQHLCLLGDFSSQ